MAIENFNEVKTYFETNKDNPEVKSFVTGLNPINLDRVKEFVGKDKDAQSWLDSEKDKHLQKGIETFKTNNLQKLVDEQYKKQYPDADPKDTELTKMKAEIEKMKADSAHKDLTNKALKYAQDKKLPANIINYFVGQDEEATKTNLKALEKEFNASVQAQIEERLKGGYKPPKDNKGSKTFTFDDLKGMSQDEINTHWKEIQSSLGKK